MQSGSIRLNYLKLVSVRRFVYIPILPLIIYRYSAVDNHNLEYDDSWTDPVLSARQYEDRLLLHMIDR